MSLRRWVSGVLAALLLLGLAGSAVAKEKGKKAHEEFKDLGESTWSVPYVAEMHAKGLMKGTGDGKFEPNGSLTRAQAITVAIRLMGLEAEAQAITTFDESNLPFTDWEKIPEWARPYVAKAVEKAIVPLADDGMLRAGEKATRLWVSVLLVKALGFDAEAQAKMTASLSFTDAKRIPARLVGYVAAAVDHGLIQGYPEGTFQPNDPVTRAQAATLLSRTDSQLADLGKLRPGQLQGELMAVDAASSTLTLRFGGQDQVITVASNAAIFNAGAEATLADLAVGSKVAAVIGADGTAVLISARARSSGELNREVKGTITALLLPTATGTGGLISLTGRKEQDEEKTYPLGPEVEVRAEGQAAAALADLKPGDFVEVKLISGVAVRIKVERRGDATAERKDELKGTLKAVTPASGDSLGSITVTVKSGDKTVNLAPEPEIKIGEHDGATPADLQVGSRVEVKVVGGVAIKIKVKAPETDEDEEKDDKDDEDDEPEYTEIRGTVTAVTESGLTVADESGAEHTLTLAADSIIKSGDLLILLADIQVGSKVEAKVKDGVVLRLNVKME